jgi:magnesium transporter
LDVTDPALHKEGQDTEATEEAVYGLDPELEERIVDALDAGDVPAVRAFLEDLHTSDTADLLERLKPDHRTAVVEALRGDFDPDILPELDEEVRDDVIEDLGVEETAAAIAELETDDAVEIIEELDEDEQQELLEAIPAGDRALIEEALAFPEDSAGRLMQREVVTAPEFWTVGETIDFLRETADQDIEDDTLPEVFYDIYVIDPARRPIGTVSLSRLMRSRRPVPVTDIMEPDMKLISATVDQEEVAFLFSQRDLVSAPVVDEAGRLVGSITIDDVVDVIHEEHEEDIMRMGGVQEDDLYAAAVDTTRSRFTWLLVNLGTAVMASIVIGLFQATIEQMVALAVLMPIVASMGGNAGTQTLTVAVRALATRELTATNAYRVVGKELMVGAINGILFAVLTGFVAWVWFGRSDIGIVIALAMVVNMVVAGFAGATIPIALDRMDIDPAVASSVVLTTITDVAGFFVFLGLAAWLLL